MVKRLLILLALALPSFAWGEQIISSQYFGLNNNASASVIDPAEAQDLLNVDVSITGNSFKRRTGYGVYKALGTLKPMHGGHHFFDVSGNDCQVWGSSTSLYGIVGGGTPTQMISSATLSATWDCADTQGFAYCVNSSRDAYIKTNGQTQTWFSSPLGTMVEVTPDRVAVAGVSGNLNTIYVSQSNTFTNFTTGLNTADAFTEPIASPGSRLTHLRWGCGKLLWWKDQSFGSMDFDDQFSISIKTISDNIGTLDNTSAIDPGGNVWFRGQDGHTYRYDCSFLTKETIPITPNVQAASIRTSNAWVQDTQSDFQTGIASQTSTISTTISPGDVTVGTFTATDTTTADFNAGTTNNTTVASNGVSLSVNNTGTATNPSFESAFAGNWTNSGNSTCSQVLLADGDCGRVNPQAGSNLASCVTAGATPFTAVAFEAVDLSGTLVQAQSITISNNCTWVQSSLTPTAANTGKRVKFRMHTTSSGGDAYTTTSDSYIWGGAITFYYNSQAIVASGIYRAFFDNIAGGSSTITTGSFTSKGFDTGLPYSTVFTSVTWTANTLVPGFVLQQGSSTTGGWSDVTTSTGVNSNVSKRYLRYISTFTVTSALSGLTTLDDVTLVSASSGTYYSATHAASALNAWDVFSVNKNDTGGSHSFFMRSSTNTFTILSSTPSWTAVTAGNQITISTGTTFQMRDDFTVTSASSAANTLAMSNFSISWFEGTATDQAYFEYFDNAIWQSVAYGAGQSTNNYIFKCDLLRLAADPSKSCWTLYNFGAGGFLVQNNVLYFGDTAAGNVFNYGTSTSDNGTAVNAFRKSKEYSGPDPFLQNQLNQIDTFAKKDQGTTLTATYATDTLVSTSFNVSLSTGGVIAQSRKLLPPGKLGYTFNLKYGDTSTSSAWEVFGYRISFAQLPYRPTQ